MKYKLCEGFGSKKGKCLNMVEYHFWICIDCWTIRESDETYKFSQYTPPDLKKFTLKYVGMK